MSAPRRSARSPEPPPEDLLLLALGEAGGAALVLDRELRVVAATPAATAILGPVPVRVSAARLLCGDAVERPVADALEAGRPVSATIPRPRSAGGSVNVRVRAMPLGHPSNGGSAPGRARGWLLLVDAEPGEGDVDAPVEFHRMWTRAAGMKRLFEIITKVARTEASVLVRGETGAGKELVASALHALSPRHSGPFRALNCAALPPALLESELFGHGRGAFSMGCAGARLLPGGASRRTQRTLTAPSGSSVCSTTSMAACSPSIFHSCSAERASERASTRSSCRMSTSRAARLVSHVRLELGDAQALPHQEASFDTVVATFVFCSVPDPLLGLREARRVLRPGGRLLLLEHVLSERPWLRWLMRRLDPLSSRLWGAHLNRDTVATVKAAGFADVRVSPLWLDAAVQVAAFAP